MNNNDNIRIAELLLYVKKNYNLIHYAVVEEAYCSTTLAHFKRQVESINGNSDVYSVLFKGNFSERPCINHWTNIYFSLQPFELQIKDSVKGKDIIKSSEISVDEFLLKYKELHQKERELSFLCNHIYQTKPEDIKFIYLEKEAIRKGYILVNEKHCHQFETEIKPLVLTPFFTINRIYYVSVYNDDVQIKATISNNLLIVKTPVNVSKISIYEYEFFSSFPVASMLTFKAPNSIIYANEVDYRMKYIH